MNPDHKKWFREHGFVEEDPHSANTNGDYALILASRQGRYDLVQMLLNCGVNPDCLDCYGNNALWAACFADSEACLRFLIKSECEIDYRNPSGNTALMFAASSGKDAIVRLLLQLGADSRIQNQDGMTALDLASSRGCLQLLRAAGTSR